MKTAQEIITEFEDLSPTERQIVVDYVVDHPQDRTFKATHLSSEDMAKINRDATEAEQGINVEKFNSMSEARKSLGLI